MRKTVLSLMSVAALALAGCNSSSPGQPDADGSSAAAASSANAPAKNANEVSGTISLRPGATPPSANAVLVINLIDASASAAGTAPLATQTSPAGTFPQSFKLTFNPADVKPDDLYIVQVTMKDGERHYTMPIQAPVLSKGHQNDGLAIQLLAEQTPGEKLLAEFTGEEKLLGGMKISKGTKLEPDASRGWQVFRQGGELKFIREDVDFGEKGGYTSTDYAFKDGKVWAVVRETRASREAKPSSIDRAGWADDGSLVLKQHQVGADVQELDADAASKLQKQGKEILGLATGGKNK
jgi:putative lipoprotein